MIMHVYTACPRCGHPWVFAAVLSAGEQARECPACEWSQVKPVPLARPAR
jgi:uncharacterized protein (DUF983 family)